jgi:hypothetical protein
MITGKAARVLQVLIGGVAALSTAYAGLLLIADFATPSAQLDAFVYSMAGSGLSLGCLLVCQNTPSLQLARRPVMIWAVLNVLILVMAYYACRELTSKWVLDSLP